MKDQSPLPSAVVVPNEVMPEKSSTVLSASAVPVRVGVVSVVILSVLELPVSEEASRSGVDGADGDAVSIVIVKALDALEVLPAASVTCAVIE